MCGICGIINFKGASVNRSVLENMNEALRHRGPDDKGVYTNSSGSAGLGMRRLSIIDLETGHQPITCEEDRYTIIFNGEIYNYRQLRKNLEGRHKFTTKSDTEVLLHLFEEKGPRCLNELNGMFAAAIWDEKKGGLFLARDRMGQKPLYYAKINSSFYFASSLNSFLEVPEFKKDINRRAVHYYLTYGYIPSPMTIWKGVYSLEPATYMIVDNSGGQRKVKYWQVDFSKKTELSYDESKEHIRELLKDAVRLRMISDVPLGAFLSGGIDSSIIVGLMSEISPEKVKTFSIGFKEENFSELEYARRAADKFGTEHNEFTVNTDYINILEHIVKHYGQPYGDSSALPTYYVSRATKKHVKVALNGDAGDENFGGYERYSFFEKNYARMKRLGPLFSVLKKIGAEKFLSGNGALKRKLRKALAMADKPPAELYMLTHRVFDEETKKKIYSDDMLADFGDNDAGALMKDKFEAEGLESFGDRMFYSDLSLYLPEDLMVKVDIASMANSLESRSPFLDYRLMEFCASFPSKWKLKGKTKKIILKDAFKEMLPGDILKRGKMGFGIPLDSWFRNEWKSYFVETVLSDRAIKRGYFKREAVEELFKEHVEGKRDNGYRMWNLLMLELWHRVFMD